MERFKEIIEHGFSHSKINLTEQISAVMYYAYDIEIISKRKITLKDLEQITKDFLSINENTRTLAKTLSIKIKPSMLDIDMNEERITTEMGKIGWIKRYNTFVYHL